jgi:predicted proteasome-type protease/uncharacterized alpha-E superfamily protein
VLDVTWRMSLLVKEPRSRTRNGSRRSTSPARSSLLGPAHIACAREVLHFMALDPENPSSIYACARQARENARSVRGSITSEMWEVLNATWLEMQQMDEDKMQARGVSGFFDWVKERSHLFRGVTFGTMHRDDAYEFARLGTHMERADSTARILDVKYHILLPSVKDVGGAVDYYQWSAVLRSVAAFEAYRKVYRDVITPLKLAELLILRDDIPRACASACGRCTTRSGACRTRSRARPLRRAGQILAALQYGRISDIFAGGLHEYLTDSWIPCRTCRCRSRRASSPRPRSSTIELVAEAPMTYCVALRLDSGMIFASDSRTNAGVDHIATFTKMRVYEKKDDRVIVVLSSGNLAHDPGRRSTSSTATSAADEQDTIWNVESMYDAAALVGDALREMHRRDAPFLTQSNIESHSNLLSAARSRARRPRLFHVYAQGNFIEATDDTPYFQLGESKYGKPILDRVITWPRRRRRPAKCVLISFDSTMKSNISVGLPSTCSGTRATACASACSTASARAIPTSRCCARAGAGVCGAFSRNCPIRTGSNSLREAIASMPRPILDEAHIHGTHLAKRSRPTARRS